MQKITKIVLTGGPCAGKSKALSRIRKATDFPGKLKRLIAEIEEFLNSRK